MLEWAAQEGYAAVIQGLQAVIQGLQAQPKEHGFPCHAKNDALCLAAANGHLQCVDPLLAMGAELSPLPFIFIPVCALHATTTGSEKWPASHARVPSRERCSTRNLES